MNFTAVKDNAMTDFSKAPEVLTPPSSLPIMFTDELFRKHQITVLNDRLGVLQPGVFYAHYGINQAGYLLVELNGAQDEAYARWLAVMGVQQLQASITEFSVFQCLSADSEVAVIQPSPQKDNAPKLLIYYPDGGYEIKHIH